MVMCGIAGYMSLGSSSDFGDASIERMLASIAHRGPDASGYWWEPGHDVVLGHRRLSVVDLSQAGAQPMHSKDGRWVLVYNGEIYNHRQLRSELESDAPTAWRGSSDTEILVEAISRWGFAATVPRLEGMFAFALYDRAARVLHLARDRFGEKPLYYGRVGETFVFGSELKSLRSFPGFSAGIDREALAEYFRLGYVPAPLSIYEGIRKLLPGSTLSLTLQGGESVPAAYWSAIAAAMAAKAHPLPGSPAAAADQLERLLGSSVARMMEADVPLGALLSGGVDSSAVVALMQSQRTDRIRTFSIGSTEPGYDEAQHARQVAAYLGTDHTELYVSATDALAVIPKLPGLYDEPFADSSQIPTYLVAQLARQHVTVALSGDAGDELFGGYNRYVHGAAVWRRVGGLPLPLRRLISGAMTSVSPAAVDRLVSMAGRLAPAELAGGRAGEKVHKLAGLLPAADQSAFLRSLQSYWPEGGIPVLDVGAAAGRHEASMDPSLCFAEKAMLHDTLNYLPDDILTKVDRASMGVSLEVRVPLLDRHVFEFAWSLPMALKLEGGQGKRVLRDVLYRHVPRELIERPKHGFAVPIAAWLRGELRDWAQALLDPARLLREGYLDPAPIQRCWREHLSGRRNWDTRLWTVLMYQAWLERQEAT
jgi:asparagine synthase (glutamine-hydrolysing)